MKKNMLLKVLFALYCAVMLWLLFDRSGGIDGVEYWEQVEMNLNLEPLHTIRNYWHILCNREYYVEKWEAYSIWQYHARQAFINLAGNVVMFIPLGFFLPLLLENLRKWWRTWLATLGIMLMVELLQLFTLRGSFDVDDLILNLAGGAIGYIVYWLLQIIRRSPA